MRVPRIAKDFILRLLASGFDEQAFASIMSNCHSSKLEMAMLMAYMWNVSHRRHTSSYALQPFAINWQLDAAEAVESTYLYWTNQYNSSGPFALVINQPQPKYGTTPAFVFKTKEVNTGYELVNILTDYCLVNNRKQDEEVIKTRGLGFGVMHARRIAEELLIDPIFNESVPAPQCLLGCSTFIILDAFKSTTLGQTTGNQWIGWLELKVVTDSCREKRRLLVTIHENHDNIVIPKGSMICVANLDWQSRKD